MIAPARPIAVEFAHGHLPFDQVLTGGGGVFERACRTDVIGGDHIAQNCKYFGVFNIRNHAWFRAHALKIRRVLNIG